MVTLLIFTAFAATANSANLPAELSSGASIASAIELSKVIGIINKHYCGEKCDESNMVAWAIEGILSKLNDPYSQYLSEQDLKRLSMEFNDCYLDGGIGIRMLKLRESSSVLVAQVIENSPAYQAGLKRGDMIVEINSQKLEHLDSQMCAEKIQGPKGSSVLLTVKRGEDRPFKVRVKRDRIEMDNVTHRMIGDIGYINLQLFARGVADRVRGSLEDLKDKGARCIILDLRDNPGGTLDDAVAVSSIFTNDLVVRQKTNHEDLYFNSLGNADLSTPLIILINEGSASGSEIVAAALKKRALLIGERTYGKGSVQAVMPISEKNAIKLTIAKFFGPDGEEIDKKGIEPDITIACGSSFMKPLLDQELNSLVRFEKFYITMLEEVDRKKEVQLDTAIRLVKAVNLDLSKLKRGD